MNRRPPRSTLFPYTTRFRPTLIVYGAPADLTVAAVLAYRVILFWLPLAAGAVAFALLRPGGLEEAPAGLQARHYIVCRPLFLKKNLGPPTRHSTLLVCPSR